MRAIKLKCVYPFLRQAVNAKLIPVVVGENITDQRCCCCKSCLIVAVWYTFIQTVKSNKLGSLCNDDGDVTKTAKKQLGLDWQNNNFARALRFLEHFFAFTARL